ncbi:MAG: sulfite exporter TauE/SafE family protein [Dehalococcoidia bacterium]|nr:sulfite exporter TauE/SafE family protein [Dehalococcoidia bacterium]
MTGLEASLLLLVGFLVGAYAAAIGAGGGFLITPLLLLRYPSALPVEVTAASLTVVAISAGVSSALGAIGKRIDYGVTALLAVSTVPTALLGAALTDLVPRTLFALGIAVLLLALAVYLTLRPRALFVTPVRRGWRREFTERGDTYVYTVPVARAVLGAAGAAFVSALSGIGGGPFHVPVATRIARIPHRLAVPSVQVTILTLSVVVVAFHLVAGHAGPPMADVPWLGVGAVLGNPVGQWVGRRLGEGPLTRALAAGLVLISLRTAWGAL